MAQKKIIPPSPEELKKIVKKQKDYTTTKIRESLKEHTGRSYSIEQKVMILRLLQLNEMDYAATSKELGIPRQSLYVWEGQYGEAVFQAEPEGKIAEKLETDLAVIQSDTLKKSYRTINKGLDKFDELIGKATSPRQIYAVSEAIKATVEVLKVEKPQATTDQPKTNDYFFQIHQLMINNIPPDGNTNKP